MDINPMDATETATAETSELSDALAAIAISLLALTSLTNKRWLYYLALIPTLLAAPMGTAGLLAWKLHFDFIAALLS